MTAKNVQNSVEVIDGVLVLTRYLHAPVEMVWKAWSEKEHLMNWWGMPKEASMPYCDVDFKVGGYFHFHVSFPWGQTLWGKGVYTEIKKPERISFDNYFSNEKGDLIMSVGKISAVLEEV